MTAKLTKELSDALHSQDDDRLEVVDPKSHRAYFIVDADTLHDLDRKSAQDAIAAGLADMEAGRGMPAEEADAHLRRKLGFPPRQTS